MIFENGLLADRTTGKNIIIATSSYGYEETTEITPELLKEIKPRTEKTEEERRKRTKGKAEVFTPSWLCNQMNNYFDGERIGNKNAFNTEDGHTWKTNYEKVKLSDWRKYIKDTVLEITCGEAPFLVSRYDTTTGKEIPISNRIGMLDRKLRVVSENTTTPEEWNLWAVEAFKSTYGYEYQGDNLLIARNNLAKTYTEYHLHRWGTEPNNTDEIKNIITWNIIQMDGLKNKVPYTDEDACIMDWQNNQIVKFKDIGGE